MLTKQAEADITRSLSNRRELHLVEHTAECDGGPGALISRQGKRLDQTCHIILTATRATVIMPAFEPRVFFPRDSLYPH